MSKNFLNGPKYNKISVTSDYSPTKHQIIQIYDIQVKFDSSRDIFFMSPNFDFPTHCGCKKFKMAQSEIFLVSSNIYPMKYLLVIILRHNLLEVFLNFLKSFEFTMC